MSKYHKIEIKQKEGTEDSPMVGANTEVFLDGVLLKGVQSAKFEVRTRGVAKLTLEVLGNYAVAGVIGDFVETVIPLVPKNQLPTCVKCKCKIVKKEGDTVCLDCWMGR